MGTGSSSGVESGRGVKLTPHILLVPRSKNRVELNLKAFVAYEKSETYLPNIFACMDAHLKNICTASLGIKYMTYHTLYRKQALVCVRFSKFLQLQIHPPPLNILLFQIC
jgi:hypothetical protein